MVKRNSVFFIYSAVFMSSFVTAMKEISTVMTSPLSLDQTHTTTFHHSFLLLIKIFLSLMILEANLML